MSNVDNNSVNNVSASGEASRLELYVNQDWKFVNINDISVSVPVEWSVRKIGDLCQLHGGVSAPKEFQQSGYPFIRVSNLHHDGINVGRSNTKEFLSGNWKTVPANTLLLAKSGESIRQHYRNITDEEAVIVGHIAGLEALPGNDIFFIRHHIRHYPFEESIILGGATPTIGLRGISNVQIRVPEQAEQPLIAQALSTQEAQVADLRKLAALERQRLTWLSDELLSGRLRVVEDPTAEPVVVSRDENGEPVEVLPGVRLVKNQEWKAVEVNLITQKVPQDWSVVALSEAFEITGGGTPSTTDPSYWGGGIPWVGPKHMGDNQRFVEVGLPDMKTLTVEGAKKVAPRATPAGSVIMSSRAPVGYSNIAPCDLYTNQGCYSFIDIGIGHPQFLYFWIRSHRQLIESRSSGTTFLEISRKAAGLLQYAIPDYKEQSLIAAVLTAQETQASELERLADLEQKRLEWLSDELLSGRLRIKVPA